MSGDNLAAVAAEAARGVSTPAAETKPPQAAAGTQQPPEGQPPAPAPKPAENPAPQPAPAAVADLDAARAEGRQAALAYVAEVNDLCAIAGQPERAAVFVAAGTPAEDVRKALLEGRAQADAGRTIATQIPAGGSAPQKGALAGRMTRLVGKREG